jgi:hypothetical protein
MPLPPSNPEHGLTPEHFFMQARQAYFEGKPIDFSAADIVMIAGDAASRALFQRIFRQEVNDPDLQHHILEYLEEVAEELDDSADTADAKVELIDRAGMPVATAATVAGIGMLVTVGVFLGPLALFGGGIAALAISGTGRTWVKLGANRTKAAARKVRRLAASLNPRSEA